MKKKRLTLKLHANFEALLKTAIGTPFPLRLVDVTGPFGDARVHLLVLDGALEETLAGLAGEQPVVVAGDLVAAHRAQLLDDDVLRVGEVGRARYRAGHDTNPDLAQSRMTEGTSW